MTKVFIDGSAGTTGLRIYERLGARKDLEFVRLPEERRKDPEARKDAILNADVAFLCLPDDASREAVGMIGDAGTRIIDTSTAFRTDGGFVYGLPEIRGQREKIRNAKRIANPGCHATGVIALLRPLTEENLIPRDAFYSAFSLTGYSGGGKKMIAEYESEDRGALLSAPRVYALSESHKHLPEIVKYSLLSKAPGFSPVVAPYYAGMEVLVTVSADDVKGTADDIRECYREYYREGLIRYVEDDDEAGFLSAGKYAGRDDLSVSVRGNGERILLVSRFDNLGKGASGAAIQNMNLLLGLPEETGLTVGKETE